MLNTCGARGAPAQLYRVVAVHTGSRGFDSDQQVSRCPNDFFDPTDQGCFDLPESET